MPAPLTVTTPTPLLPFLFASWPDLKKKQVRTWLKYQAVTVNGRVTTQFDHALKAGDVVAIRTDRFTPPDTKLPSGLKILHEDHAIIVVDKPSGLLSIATEQQDLKTAYAYLVAHLREGDRYARDRVWIVHRLDRETSGLMIFARSEAAKRVLQANWEKAEKKYQAVIEGALPRDTGRFDSYLDESDPFKVRSVPRSPAARRAVTDYRVLKKGPKYSLVELSLETGRRHQIRVHLADAGCPIVGDEKYHARTDPTKRLALHACFLRLLHPETQEPIEFISHPPSSFQRLV